MSPEQAYAIIQSIRRNSPFFRGYQTFGRDFRTFRILYPQTFTVYSQCLDAME